MNIWISRILRSKTMSWGHIQIILGTVLAGIKATSPDMILNVLKAATPLEILAVTFGYAAITYWLRSVTTQPLSDK